MQCENQDFQNNKTRVVQLKQNDKMYSIHSSYIHTSVERYFTLHQNVNTHTHLIADAASALNQSYLRGIPTYRGVN